MADFSTALEMTGGLGWGDRFLDCARNDRRGLVEVTGGLVGMADFSTSLEMTKGVPEMTGGRGRNDKGAWLGGQVSRLRSK